MILGGAPESRRKGYGSQPPTQLGEIRSEGDTRTWMDKQHRMEEAIPPVAPQTVRAAALTVVERYGPEGAELLAMLGITAETLTTGFGYQNAEVA